MRPAPLLLLVISAAVPARADDSPTPWALHFQQTVVVQAHPAFPAAYSGENSLSPARESATSITSTLFLGARLWRGAEIHFNPELSGGAGVSQARGLGGFANGETFRIGSTSPVVYLARLFVRQVFRLGGDLQSEPPSPNEIAGEQPARRLTLLAGRLGVADVFDSSRYSHDPRTQFLNWALMNSGAWDYPADTRGYTWGLLADLTADRWSARGAATLVPREANGLAMDTHIAKAHGLTLELERRHELAGQDGAVRLLLYRNDARMGSYDQSLAAGGVPDVTATRSYGRTKLGFALGAEQAIGRTRGAFARLSANDGRNETWAYAEIDRSLALGLSQTGAPWRRAGDELAAALILDGLSSPHRRYLAAGGHGFMLGDGALRYGIESIVESYYRAALTGWLSVSVDYQMVVHPGYNRDRGPVHLFAGRVHAEL
jgi:high affinity Mn2+ porin